VESQIAVVEDYPLVIRSQVDDFKNYQIGVCQDMRNRLYDILAHKEEQILPDTKMLQQGGLSLPNAALKGGVTYIQNQSVNIQINTSVVECLKILDSMLNRILLFELPDPPPKKKIIRKRRKRTSVVP